MNRSEDMEYSGIRCGQPGKVIGNNSMSIAQHWVTLEYGLLFGRRHENVVSWARLDF